MGQWGLRRWRRIGGRRRRFLFCRGVIKSDVVNSALRDPEVAFVFALVFVMPGLNEPLMGGEKTKLMESWKMVIFWITFINYAMCV